MIGKMSKLLLDTSIIIDYLRKKDKSQTILYNLVENGNELYASIVVHTESYAGRSIWERKDAKLALETLFGGIKILPLNESISINAGKICASYGTDIVDAIIAATALSHNLKLATLNLKDFEKVEGVRLFKS